MSGKFWRPTGRGGCPTRSTTCSTKRRETEQPSRVTFVLEPHGKLVKLTLTHEDFAEDSVVLDGISKGWPAILSSLKSHAGIRRTALAIPLCLALSIEGFDAP